jgi:hypothetical protein
MSNNNIRILAENAHNILSSISTDTTSSGRSIGNVFNALLLMCIWMPTAFILFIVLLLFLPIQIILHQCCHVGGMNFYHIIFQSPTEWLQSCITVITHPIHSSSMFSNKAQQVRITAQQLSVEKSQTVFVIPRHVMLNQWTFFPKHEDVVSSTMKISSPTSKNSTTSSPLLEIKDLRDMVRNRGDTLFVSHKWIGNQPDNDQHQMFQLVLAKIKQNKNFRFIWFDYTCVPQAPEAFRERNRMLFAIPDLVMKTWVIAFHLDDNHKHLYESSVWCALEAMGSFDTPSWEENRNWTIYDKKDLYACIPAFIEMAFSTRYRLEFVRDNTRAQIFVSILELFIKYHDGLTSTTTLDNNKNNGLSSMNTNNMMEAGV